VGGGGTGILWPIGTVAPLRDVTEPLVAIVAFSSYGCGWLHIFAHCYCDLQVAPTSDRETSHEPVATQGRNSYAHSVISLGPITTKDHNSRSADRLIPPHSQKVGLTNISTCLQQNLRAVTTDIVDISFLYPLSSSWNYVLNLINSWWATIATGHWRHPWPTLDP
jgi:hypothetical protein